MARFETNRPVTTTTATVLVEADLPPGRHRFSLVVVDSRGRRSMADVLTLQVQEGGRLGPSLGPAPRPPLQALQPPRPAPTKPINPTTPTGGHPPRDQEPTA